MGRDRLGVLGGTFDPPHLGHLILAQEALAQLSLDYVLLMPAGVPWRKDGRPISPAEHRLAMTRLAAQGDPRLRVSTLEIERRGPSYTAETLEQLQRALQPLDMYFIIGGDALADLPNWHEPPRIIAAARLAVAGRPGWPIPPAADLDRTVPGLSSRIVALAMPLIDISATWLRERARQGLPLRYLVPDTVAEYIERHRLYAEE